MSGPYRKPAERPAVPRDLRRWYTKAGDVEKGPFDTETLIRSARDGYIKRTTLVRAEDEREWRALSEVVAFTPVVVRVPRKQKRRSQKRVRPEEAQTDERLDAGDVSRDPSGRMVGGLCCFIFGAVGSASSHAYIALMITGLLMMGSAVHRWLVGGR